MLTLTSNIWSIIGGLYDFNGGENMKQEYKLAFGAFLVAIFAAMGYLEVVSGELAFQAIVGVATAFGLASGYQGKRRG